MCLDVANSHDFKHIRSVDSFLVVATGNAAFASRLNIVAALFALLAYLFYSVASTGRRNGTCP